MKRNIKFNMFGWSAVAALLFATACRNDLPEEPAADMGDYEVVSFTISPEVESVRTRSDEDFKSNGMVKYPGAGETAHISDGTKADILKYAVYDENGELLEEFGDPTRPAGLPDHITIGKGQTVRMVGEEHFPVKVEFKMKRDKTYKVAFWAQSSKCKAYDTEDLAKVRVIYEEIDGDETATPNNDELRDAFCRTETITVDRKSNVTNRFVYLYRPLAQINVGTTGYDYEIVVKDDLSKYIYSRVQIFTAARYLNVVTDEITAVDDSAGAKDATESRSALDFTYAPIPAYINCYTSDYAGDEAFLAANDISTVLPKEEFLKVKLYSESDIKGNEDKYTEDKDGDGFLDYADLKENDGMKTETFKYLSMCYILVPSNAKTPASGNARPVYEPTTIDNVNVWIATSANGGDEAQIISLVNVPAQRNWRTNIVGNILTDEVEVSVTLDPMYAGDYNGEYDNGGIADWSGPLAEGAYYDAVNDEILISNINGLLWFQQMVNGKMVYRETHKNYTSQLGQPYQDKYYDALGGEHDFGQEFKDLYIAEPEDEVLARRILKATHQDGNTFADGKWPEYCNFQFTGIDSKGALNPAKVKLMADIDLGGIDWLPIGFDCMVYDGSMVRHVDITDNKVYINTDKNLNMDMKASTRRMFCGKFDGNGHVIRNLRNIRFGADVLDVACQEDSNGPYDNPQWFPAALFGMLSGNAEISNLTVVNVDLFGYHTGGGIVGTVDGYNVNITGCVVDGGQIVLSPMYRGDKHKSTDYKKGENGYAPRTFARGIYVGGIVGYYNADGNVTGCEVRNLDLHAYRNIGGVIGTVGADLGTSNKHPKGDKATVSGNTVSNVIIIADKFKPYDNFFSTKADGVYKNAYGWNQNQLALSGYFVGGPNADSYDSRNTGSDIIKTEFSTRIDAVSNTKRIAEILDVPLNYLPMLSSWFCDELTLEAHFTGKPSAYKRYHQHDFTLEPIKDTKGVEKSDIDGTFKIFPFDLPGDTSVDFDTASGNVGMYVESITMDGVHTDGNGKEYPYSVLTVENVTGENDCAMFITARNMDPFMEKHAADAVQATSVSNMIVRGIPSAYTGICLSPNKYMSSITLDNVSVYDVYRTLALDNTAAAGDVWPSSNDIDAKGVTLSVSNANLRGYTVPGAGWKSVTYTDVIFERGASIVNDDTEKTCKVEATAEGTTFAGCEFKAPFVIEIADGAVVKFENCKTGDRDTDVVLPEGGCSKIVIDSDSEVQYVK